MAAAPENARQRLAQIPVARVPVSAAQRAAPAAAAQATPAPAPGKPSMRGRPLGEILVAHGRIDEASLEAALERHRRFGGRLSELLVAEGRISELDVVRALSEQTGIPFVSDARIERMEPPAEALALLPMEAAERLRVLPLALKGKELICAMPEPRDLAVVDEVKFLAGVPVVRGVFATDGAIRKGLRRFYRGEVDEPGEGWETLPGAELVTPWPAGHAWAPPPLPPLLQPVVSPAQPVAPALVAGPAIPEALVLPEMEAPAIAEALVLEEDPAREAERIRRRTAELLLACRGGAARLPGLVRRLAARLGAAPADVERAGALAEAAILLAPQGPVVPPDPTALVEALGADVPCADLLACLAGGDDPGPAAIAFAVAARFTAAGGAGALEQLAADPRLPAAAIEALRAELAA